MARTKEQLIARATRLLPRAFHAWLPYLCGQAAATAEAEAAVDTMADAVLPSSAEGPWLQALAEDQAITPRSGEGAEALRARIRAGQLGSDIVSLDRALGELLGETPYALVEHHEARVYCDDDPDEYVADAFADEGHLLPAHLSVAVIVDEDLDDALLRAVGDLCNRWRAVGVRTWLVEEDGLRGSVIFGAPRAVP